MFHEIVPNSFKRQNNEVLVVKSNVRSSKSANIKKPEEWIKMTLELIIKDTELGVSFSARHAISLGDRQTSWG